MFINVDVANTVNHKQISITRASHFNLNAQERVHRMHLSNEDKIILQPGLTFRNITNNTKEPMDITDIIVTMDRQLETRFSKMY